MAPSTTEKFMILDVAIFVGCMYGAFWLGGKCQGKLGNFGKKVSDLFHKLDGSQP